MQVRTAWPGGSPSVRSSAYDSAPMTSESGTSSGRGPAPIGRSMPGSIRRRMRALQITELSGPAAALDARRLPEPEAPPTR